jgi:LPXTG-motif cell wall-anchored protein
MLSKGLRVTLAAGVLAVSGVGSGPAWADHTPGGSKAVAPCAPNGTSLAVTAENHKFDKDCLAVTAGQSFTIRFDNRDTDRHNVAILPAHTAIETIFAGDILPGPKSTVYAVPNMKAGTYHFHCEVHPNLMNGTFVVAAAPVADGKAATKPAPETTDEKTPAASPTTATAAPKKADAAPAPKADRAPVPAAAPKPAPATASTASASAGGTAVAGTKLPRTGPADQALLLLAGLALAAGGLSVLAGAKPRA